MPSRNRQQRIESLFNEAASIDTTNRGAFLEEKCAGDAELRAEVESMLARHDGMTEDFLEAPAGNADVLSAAHSGERLQIGPYKILETLGEGGFGVVYLAEQTSPVVRKVALKVIKPGMDSKAVLARFEAERQALAMMDHPAISKVFDAGVSEQGRPYFAMERVKGSPITEFCDRHKLGLKERISLFMQVCEAIQHAHQKGVIHRDIKPSNILVEYEDEKPSPKVIDFGVAKALHQKLTEKTIFTEQGQLIGTPEYMSPEQAEMSELDIDTRSDVYSLGILLYELLSGRLPFESDTLRSAGYAEIQRIIREVDPPKPSTRLSTMLGKTDDSEVASRIATARSVNPADLPKRLRGDLDWIVMKCLEKERSRRYATANAIGEELKRYLKSEPVLAGPPSVGYRTKKFVRRNRAGVIAASIVLVVLTAGLIGTTYGLIAANSARQLAQQRADELQVITDFQSEMLSGVDPQEMGLSIVQRLRDDARASAEAAGATEEEIEGLIAGFNMVTARANPTNAALQALDEQILARAIETIDEQFTDQPMTDAALRGTIGEVYRTLGLLENAEPALTRSLETRHRTLGDEDPDTLASMHSLANIYESQGRYDEAEALFTQTLESRRRILGDEHRGTLASMYSLANIYGSQGRYDEAEALHTQTLDLCRRILGDEHPNTLASMNSLANLYEIQGRYDEAEALHTQTLESRRRVLGDEHPVTIDSMNNLAVLYRHQGRYDEAEALYTQSLELRRRVLGDEHPATLASMNNLAIIYESQGRYDEAETLYTQSLDLCRRILGNEHPDTLASMMNLADLYKVQGRYDAAETLQTQSLDLCRRILGDEHPNTLASMNNLAILYNRQGRYDEAETLYTQSLDLRRRVLGDEHPLTIDSMSNLAVLYYRQGRYDEAETLYTQSLDLRRRVLGDEHPVTIDSMSNLAVLYYRQGRYDDGETLYTQSLDLRRRILGDEHPSTLGSINNLAIIYEAQGRDDDARTLRRELLNYRLSRATSESATATDKNALAWDLLTSDNDDLRDPTLALRLATEACEMTDYSDPGFLDTLALAQHMTGDTIKALETQRRAIALLPEDTPEDDGLRVALEESLAEYEAALEESAAPVEAGSP